MDQALGQDRSDGNEAVSATTPLPAPERLTLLSTELDPGAATPPTPATCGERAVYVLQGAGEARIGSTRRAVATGDVLRLPPGAALVVCNTGVDQRLVFLTATPPAVLFAGREGLLANTANRLAWLLRRVARRLQR